MFFSRITIDAKSADPDDLVALIKGDVYSVHQILWRLFPEDRDAERDFLFRREDTSAWPFFYLVSKRKPQSITGLIRVESKPYQPELKSGQQLAFSLRVNPVVTKKSADGKKRFRHDIAKTAAALPFPAFGHVIHTIGQANGFLPDGHVFEAGVGHDNTIPNRGD